jgi:MbtH protein
MPDGKDKTMSIFGDVFGDEEATFEVVMNHEEQYSIWPTHREVPAGWRTVGKSGKKKECLAYIEEVWTDMQPLSLRKRMEEAACGGKD